MGRFLTLSAFVLLAVGVIVATIPSFIDWQSWREPIEQAASDAIGRDVKISGSVGFTILPYPSVDLGGVTVANHTDGISTNLLTLEMLSAKLALAPLLRGAVQIETFEIAGADLRLERSDEGVNWSFSRNSEDGGVTGGRVEALLIKAIRDISIKDFSARDIKVSYADTISGQTFSWNIQHGQASLASMNGPFEAEGRVLLGEEAFYVTGKIGTMRPDRPRPVFIDALTADGLSFKFDGSADRSSGALVVRGRTEIIAPKAHQLVIPFAAITGTGARTWAGTSTLELPAKLVGQMALSAGAVKGAELEIEIGTAKGLGEIDLKVAQAVTGTVRIESKTLNLDELAGALSHGAAGAAKSETGPDIDVEIAVAAASATLRDTRIDDVDFAIRLLGSGPALGSFKAMLPGQTRTVYALKDASRKRGFLTLETSDARGFLTWMGADLEGSRSRSFRTLTLTGDVITGDKDIKLTSIKAALDGVKIEGALVRTRAERPSLGANLEVLGLDLERFGTGANVETWLDYMSAFDINAILKLRQFTGFDLARRSVDVKAQMVRGALTLEDLQVYGTPDLRLRGKLSKDAGGLLSGKMRLDAKGLALCSLVEKRSGVTMPGCAGNPMFKATAKFDVASGKASGAVVATAKGLAYEGSLGGAQTLFADTFNLTFDGKGEVGKVTYKIAGDASDLSGKALVAAKLEAEAPQLSALLTTFGAASPWSQTLTGLIENKGAVTLGVDLNVQPKVTTFENMALRIGSASLAGSGSVTQKDNGQVFDLKLSGEKLALLAPHGSDGWSTRTFDFAIPKKTSGALALSLKDTVLGGITVPTASLKAQVNSGGLSLDIGDAQAFGGTWEGDVELREGKTGLIASAEGKARDLNLQEFLAAALGTRGLTGQGDLSFSVSADGKSWKSLVENSAGMLGLKASNGTARGFDLPGFSAGLKDASGELGARLVVEGALSSGATKYTNLEAEMTLADGKLRAISLVGALEGGSLTGEGEIDLASLSMKGRTVIDLTDYKDLPKFRSALSGPLKKPQTVWDAEELVLKFTEAWLLSSQTTEMPALPGSDGVSVTAEELDDLAAPDNQ